MTKQSVPHSDSSHKHKLTRYTKNENFQDKRDHPDQLPKGVASKHRKKSKNYELLTSLASNFHLGKTKQSNLKESKATQTDIQEQYWTLACYVLELDDCGTVSAERCTANTGNTVHAHIHIYIYPGLWSCRMSHTHFLPLHVVMVSLACPLRSSCSHLQPYSSLSAA